MATGGKTKYNDEMKARVIELASEGKTDNEIAHEIGVARSTLSLWKIKHEDLSDSLKEMKADADSTVEASLYQRACGYSNIETKVFCNAKGEVTEVNVVKNYPPDPVAAIFWLKNRQPDKWRDKQEFVSDGAPMKLIIERSGSKDDD